MKYFSNSTKQTEQIASDFAKALIPGDVIALRGGLGAGKTAFVRGLARGLSIEDYITSPTFVILNEYEGDMPLYHFDMYRLENPTQDALFDVGFFDYLSLDGVCAIEWSENIAQFLPKRHYVAALSHPLGGASHERIIDIEQVGGEE